MPPAAYYLAMLLSILICSLAWRSAQLRILLDSLEQQIRDAGGEGVEVLTDVDDGAKTVGRKRNDLLVRSTGEYVCFHDDDDPPRDTYVRHILDAILASTPDVVGIIGSVVNVGDDPEYPYMRSLRQSIKCDSWGTTPHRVERTPNHLNPVRRALAMQVGFADCDAAEDRDYAARLRPLLRTEQMVAGPVYQYRYSAQLSATNDRPPGYAYRNAFGGNFQLRLRCVRMFMGPNPPAPDQPVTVTVHVGSGVVVTQAVCPAYAVIDRLGPWLSVKVNERQVFEMPTYDPQGRKTLVTVAGPQICVTWPPESCVADNRKIKYP